MEIDPLAYGNPVDGVFSFQPFNVQKVIKLRKATDAGKASGLDKIPNSRLLKIAADAVAPSLTGILDQSLVTNISPLTGNWLKCHQLLRMVLSLT